MRPAVHPNGSPLLIRAEVLLVRNDLLRRGLFLRPHPELQRTTIDVRKAIRLALMLEKIHARDIETLGIPPGRVVERHARKVALHVTGYAIALIFVILADPLAFKIDLSRCERSHQQQYDDRQTTMKCLMHIWAKTSPHYRDRCREVPRC